MGMMIRRNLKKRAAKQTAPFVRPVEEKVSVVSDVEEKTNQYTKTEINRMSTAELKELALEEKIDGSDDMTGGELKKILIEHFKL